MRRDLPSPPEDDPVLNLWDSLTPPVVIETIDPRPGSIQEAFDAFHRDNYWVYEALRRLALDLVGRGRTKIGMKMLFEVVRWSYQRSTTDDSSPFLINNNFTSRYARLLMDQEPALAGVFDLRALKVA